MATPVRPILLARSGRFSPAVLAAELAQALVGGTARARGHARLAMEPVRQQ